MNDLVDVEVDGPAPRRLRVSPRFPLHSDPRRTVPDNWSAASHFSAIATLPRSDANSPNTAAALSRAEALSAQANDASCRDEDLETAATLHLLAVELRRQAGSFHLCLDNYAALTRHYLARQDFKPAIAYMRKMIYVSEYTLDVSARMNAYLLAASVYISVDQGRAAEAMVAKAAHLAPRTSDPRDLAGVAEILDRIGELADNHRHAGPRAPCVCGSGAIHRKCCGQADEIPAEFQVQAHLVPAIPGQSRNSPWWSPGTSGIDLIMEHPGPQGECLNWVAMRVEDGRHRLVALPNWSGRAMRAAKAMVAFSRSDSEGTEGPSSAVLQVCCAIEAFINSVTYFIAESGEERWTDIGLPELIFTNTLQYSRDKNVVNKWDEVGSAIFREKWKSISRIDDLKLLIKIRNNLVHYKGDNEECIAPTEASHHEMLKPFVGRSVLRDPPRPWIDRLLTPELAEWAVSLGEGMIASFRDAWAADQRAFELNMALQDIEHGLMHPD